MKKNVLTKGILILTGLAMIFNMFGCAKEGKKDEVKFLEFRVSGYNPGLEFKIEDGRVTYENFDEGVKEKKKLDNKTASEIIELLDRLDIYSWDGYKETDEEVLDGKGFTLFVTMADGTNISASGDNCFPENYQEFEDAIRSFMEK